MLIDLSFRTVNGDDGDGDDDMDGEADDDDDDGNDADNDETLDPSSKRIKLEDVLNDSDAYNADIKANGISTECHICKETFPTRASFIIHMRNAHGRPRLFGPQFGGPHLQVTQQHNVNNRLRCRLCQKRIHTKAGYKRHMLNEHQVRDCVFIKCKLCPSEFSNDKGLKVHMFRTHNITVQQMQQDDRLVPITKQESTQPTSSTPLKIAPKVMFECDICHTVYRNRDQLKAHKNIVHNITDRYNHWQ